LAQSHGAFRLESERPVVLEDGLGILSLAAEARTALVEHLGIAWIYLYGVAVVIDCLVVFTDVGIGAAPKLERGAEVFAADEASRDNDGASLDRLGRSARAVALAIQLGIAGQRDRRHAGQSADQRADEKQAPHGEMERIIGLNVPASWPRRHLRRPHPRRARQAELRHRRRRRSPPPSRRRLRRR